MEIPHDYELLSLFEVEPKYLDDVSQVPSFYNTAIYSFTNKKNQNISVTISPSYGEIKISVQENDNKVFHLSFRDILSFSILKDDSSESRIMLTKEHTVIKIDFKSTFKIFLEDEIAP